MASDRSLCTHGGGFPRPASPDLFGGSPGVSRNFQVFDALDFIAGITQHIPDARTHLVRYFGFYSNKSRGMRAKAAGDEAHDAQSPAPRSPSCPKTHPFANSLAL